MKWIKRIIIIFISLLILVVGGLVTIAFVLEKPLINKVLTEAEKQINGKVEIKDFDLSFFTNFPNFTLQMDSISAYEPDSDNPVVSIKNIKLNIDILKYLDDEIKINKVLVDEPTIHFIVYKDSLNSIDKLIGDKFKKENKSEEEIAEIPNNDTTTKKPLPKINLKSLEIQNAQIYYSSMLNSTNLLVQNLNYTLTSTIHNDIVDLVSDLVIENITLDLKKSKMAKNLSFKSKINAQYDLANKKVVLKENLIQINQFAFQAKGEVSLEPMLDCDLEFFTNDNKFSQIFAMLPEDINNKLKDVESNGVFQFSGKIKGKLDSKNKVFPLIDFSFGIQDAWLKYPKLPEKIDDLSIAINIKKTENSSLDKLEVSVNPLKIKIGDHTVSTILFAKNLISDPYVKTEIGVDIVLDKVKNSIPLPDSIELSGFVKGKFNFEGNLSDIKEKRYQKLNVKGDIKLNEINIVYPKTLKNPLIITKLNTYFDTKNAKLRNFETTIGSTDLKINGKLENYLNYFLYQQKLTGRLNIVSNKMDLVEVLKSDTTKSEKIATKKPKDSTKKMKVAVIPDNLDLKLNLNIKDFTFNKIQLNNLLGNISVAKQRASIKNISFNTLKGSVKMIGYYEATTIKKAGVLFDMSINKIDIPSAINTFDAIKKIVPIADKVEGAFSGKLNLTTKLDSLMNPIYWSLNSVGKLQTHNIKVNEISYIDDMNKKFGTNISNKLDKVQDLNISYNITSGVLSINTDEFEMGKIKGRFEGTYDIGKDNMNIDLYGKLSRKEMSEYDKKASELENLAKSNGIKYSAPKELYFGVNMSGPKQKPAYKFTLGEKGEGFSGFLDNERKKLQKEIGSALEKKAKEKINQEKEKLKKKAEKAAKKEINKKVKKIKTKAKEKLKDLFKF